MSTAGTGGGNAWRSRLSRHWAEPQHRNGYFLILNNVLGAGTGVLFWLLFARILDLPPATVGVGFTIVALGTIMGVLAKGGLDTALLRTVPRTSRAAGRRLLGFGIVLGSALALLLALCLSYLARWLGTFHEIGPTEWLLAAAIAALLVTTWLQDAHFLAEGDARDSLLRNAVFSAARLVLPIWLVTVAIGNAVAASWALALLASALFAALRFRAGPERPAGAIGRTEFLASAVRNLSGSAAEFLPGLLLAPLVLAIDGPEASAYFGIAWTAASLLFLASAAISRSTLAEMVRNGPGSEPAAIRRAALQHLLVVLPGAILAAVLAPWLLGVFGPAYAQQGAPILIALSASILLVAPTYLYLAFLRAHERPVPLALFPAAMVLALAVLAPPLAERYGLPGVALAWFLANLPFGVYALVRLRHHAQGVKHAAVAQGVPGPAHVE